MSALPTLGRFARSVLACAFIVPVSAGVAYKGYQAANAPEPSSPFVFVDIDGRGHGSASHLGEGYFLTAGHVTKGAKNLTIRTNDGYSFEAEILWQNNEYDVAMIYVPKMGTPMEAVELSCKKNFVGQQITITGNPLDTVFAKSWGRVSGLGKTGLENRYDGMWTKLIALDITAAPGVSGAGVINNGGELVGILVAGAVSERGNFGYSYMVPSSSICHLMART